MAASPSNERPIWPGCAVCLWKRDQRGEEPMDGPPDEGVFVTGDGGFHCSVCDSKVARLVDAVELITDRFGPDASDTERVLLDRVVGYFPPDRDNPPEAEAFAREQWLLNVHAILTHAQLLDAGESALKISNHNAELL